MYPIPCRSAHGRALLTQLVPQSLPSNDSPVSPQIMGTRAAIGARVLSKQLRLAQAFLPYTWASATSCFNRSDGWSSSQLPLLYSPHWLAHAMHGIAIGPRYPAWRMTSTACCIPAV